jgi:alpha-L-fucosidase
MKKGYDMIAQRGYAGTRTTTEPQNHRGTEDAQREAGQIRFNHDGTTARRTIQPIGVALVLLILGTIMYCAQPVAAAEAGAPAEAIKKWQDMRFGMFIHWGPVSLKGTEIGWSRNPGPNGAGGGSIPAAVYDNLYKEFNPTKFDAKEWVAIAQGAGMKYIVLVTKHHDGFCEFDSKLTDYKITSEQSPFKRDIVKELSAACHAAGMKFGTYYSQPDEHHPDYRKATHAKYIEYLHGQVRELLTNYGEISVIWFDGLGGSAKDWDAATLLPMIRELQPNIMINNRCGMAADFDTPEQTIGGFKMSRPWESCMTLSAHNAWAYGGPHDGVKSLASCLNMLINCAGGDGNMLLNVGPMPTGEIDPGQAARLKEMGEWMSKNGESIYGTRGGPWKPSKSVVSTRKDDVVYIHVLKWAGETITLPGLPKKIVASSVLTGGNVQVTQTDSDVTLTVAKADQQEIDTIIKLKLDGPAMEIAPMSASVAARGLITPAMNATASNVYQHNPEYGPEKATDGDPETRWATDAGTTKARLEVDLGKPMTFDRAAIDEAFPGRVQSFELQYKVGDDWRTACKGTTIGAKFETPKFDAVTAQQVRLNILDANEGPTISEFQLLAPGGK